MQPKKCNVLGTIKISITRPVAGKTVEMFPVSDTELTTYMAGFGCIGRINQDQGDTSLLSLVCQEFSELIESPPIDSSSLSLPGFLVDIISDTRKVFQSYLCRYLLRPCYNCFTDFMVNLSLIAALLSRKSLLEFPTSSPRTPCTFGSFLLENSAHGLIMFLDFLDSLAAKHLTFGSYSDIRNTKIHSKNLVGLDLRRSNALGLDIDVILRSFFAERSTCRFEASEPVSLVVSENKLDSLPGSEEGKADRFIPLPEGKDPSVIVNAGGLEVLDRGTGLTGSLTIASNPIDSSDGEVSRQTELGPDIPVNNVVQFNAISNDSRNSLIDPIASIGKRLQSIIYLGYLVWSRCHLATCGQDKFSHFQGGSTISSYTNVLGSVPNSSRPLKEEGLLGDLL